MGTDVDLIVTAAGHVLSGDLRAAPAANPYGDGNAAVRSAVAIEALQGLAYPASAADLQTATS
ncbi:hypothetical protein D5S19_29715 [Amycolatopsis panacis]|uniref:Uncharacterized protein n=1 Tax=Amycolatopsis panacis TaxID=2340917 RepID=A0A419HLN7_9PSEU|nr:hypothetical protein D5S19_29715 [Amycolatopsis panacis]